MSVNRRPNTCRGQLAVAAATIFLLLLATSFAPHAQTSPFTGPFCTAPPAATDTWPMAGTDNIGTTTSVRPIAFTGASLLVNDTGSSLRVNRLAATSANGGAITGADPYAYTARAGFTGSDVFTYEIIDGIGEKTVGLVKVTVGADNVAPTVSITAPAAGTVSGVVTITASAADNVGVAGVSFFDGTTAIGVEDTASPYQATWDTRLYADGSTHNLSATARDAAGNAATSAAVAVTVNNAAPPPPPPPPGPAPAVEKTVFSDGLGKRTTAAFSTSTMGDVLVAFAASDGPQAVNGQNLTISGAGLTWTRVQRANTQFGSSEIWTATASAALINATVSSTQSSAGFYQSLTVIAFTGVSGVGASSSANAGTGAPSVSLVSQSAGSLVYAVGNDWDNAIARSVPAGQTKVHEYPAPAGDTMWVQALAGSTSSAGQTVRLNDTAPTTDRWNYAIVELKPASAPAPPTMTTVPNVVGSTQTAAQSAISAAGLTVGTVTSTNNAAPAGQVIGQNPIGGSSAVTGSAVAMTVSLGPAPPVAGPVLALSFNETSGSMATDSSGNGNSGSISGASRIAGQAGYGGALSFDGVSSIVTVPHSASLALSTGMTLEAWVNPTANAGAAPNDGWRTVILKERGTNGLAYALYGNDGNSNPSRPAGYINSGFDKEATTGPQLPVGVWSHIAVTYDNTAIRLYVNGALRSTFTTTGAISASTAPLQIGGNNVFSLPGTEFFAGLIDEVRVYNRALSAAEIATDMSTPLP